MTRKEKRKKKLLEYDTDKEESEWSKFDTRKNENRNLETKSESAKRALKSVNQKLRRFTRQNNPMMRYNSNEYMAHHYVYMTKVVEMREPESYVEAAKDKN